MSSSQGSSAVALPLPLAAPVDSLNFPRRLVKKQAQHEQAASATLDPRWRGIACMLTAPSTTPSSP